MFMQNPQIVPDCSLYDVQPILIMSWKFINQCSHNIAKTYTPQIKNKSVYARGETWYLTP